MIQQTEINQSKEIVLILKEAQLGITELKRWAPLNWYERHLVEKADKFFEERSNENYTDAVEWLYKCCDDGALPAGVAKSVNLARSICKN